LIIFPCSGAGTSPIFTIFKHRKSDHTISPVGGELCCLPSLIITSVTWIYVRSKLSKFHTADSAGISWKPLRPFWWVHCGPRKCQAWALHAPKNHEAKRTFPCLIGTSATKWWFSIRPLGSFICFMLVPSIFITFWLV
jgi:hypothetical protein